MASDEDLIASVAAGDGAALAALYRRWERPLFRFLARHVGDADAADLQHDTWLRVVGAAPRFEPGRRFSTWLFQIALNLARDRHRRRQPEPRDPDALAELAGGGSDMARADAAIDARTLLAELPEAQRTVLMLRYYHDMSEAEVADVVGCPPGTVKSRLHHAIRALLARHRDHPRVKR